MSAEIIVVEIEVCQATSLISGIIFQCLWRRVGFCCNFAGRKSRGSSANKQVGLTAFRYIQNHPVQAIAKAMTTLLQDAFFSD